MKHPERRLRHYLEDILAAAQRITRYVQGLEGDDFLASDLVQDAVIRNFEVIGEASKHVLQRFKPFAEAHPELPLVQAYEMRNFVAHGYQQVDPDVLWTTIGDDLPELERRVVACLEAFSDQAGD